LGVAAAADERAQRVRAAHQAKLARAEQLAAVVQQKKVEQTAQLKERSKLVTMRNEEVHHKRLLALQYHVSLLLCTSYDLQLLFLPGHTAEVRLWARPTNWWGLRSCISRCS